MPNPEKTPTPGSLLERALAQVDEVIDIAKSWKARAEQALKLAKSSKAEAAEWKKAAIEAVDHLRDAVEGHQEVTADFQDAVLEIQCLMNANRVLADKYVALRDQVLASPKPN